MILACVRGQPGGPTTEASTAWQYIGSKYRMVVEMQIGYLV